MTIPYRCRPADGGRFGVLGSVSRPARLTILSIVWIVLTSFAGCGGDSPAGDSASDQGNGAGGRRQDLPAIPVAVQPASRGSISSYYTTTTSLEPNKQADVLARVSGVVLGIRAEEGDRVGQGAELLRIEDDEYRVRLKEAEAELIRQESRFQRATKMFEQHLVAAEEFEAAKNDRLAAEAARDLATLELSYTTVTSPFAGRVVRRYVDPGQSVSQGTQLFQVADLGRLLARVHVPAKEFRSIRADQPVELSLDSSEDLLVGTIKLVSPIIDPATGTIKVTVEITDYPPTTRPGDFAEVRIVTDRHSDTVLVPKTAVISDKGERVVYVVADSTAERRVVMVGFESDARSEIVSGLEGGETIVIQGQRSLKDGQPVKILEKMEFESDKDRVES